MQQLENHMVIGPYYPEDEPAQAEPVPYWPMDWVFQTAKRVLANEAECRVMARDSEVQ